MKQIQNYTIRTKLAETRNSIVYQGTRDSDNMPIIIKALNAEYPSPSGIARFKQEFDLIKSIKHEGIVKVYNVEEYNGGYAIILEDFAGTSLKEILLRKKFDLEQILKIGIELAFTLGHLHRENIIHRDIKPASILINEHTGQVKLTDFGISKILTNEDEEIYNPSVIEGTLLYASPEQTGRMNRTLDYRTDLYSLGITLYEMLTGSPPFRSNDPMEIIHSHIARKPIYPGGLDSRIPDALSEIIIKLLSKTAEERYQNGFGLKADLQECLSQFEKTGSIQKFMLAGKDISMRFIIPQTVYGREKEINLLMAAFKRAGRSGNELVLVSGNPGIGKSAVVNEIHKPVLAMKGYFISGKYDKFRQEVPYNAIIQAMQGMVDLIITESDERITFWKRQLSAVLGRSGGFLTSVIPRLELIIGKQQEIQDSDDIEFGNLFNNALRSMINVFATQDHPLVLFLDDAHWADAASLAFIRRLAADFEIRHFLMVLSYRDNETYDAHPFITTIEKIKKTGVVISSIMLGPLDAESVNMLICNFLRTGEEETRPLAELVCRKTNGNPFFVNEFLKAIYEAKMLTLDPASGWAWNIIKINEMQATDNVVDLMIKAIISLPPETQEIMKICACIGNRFDLETISNVFNKPIEETLTELTKAMDRELISLSGDLYIFHHDRIQEAVYSLLSENEKKEMHYHIGNHLLKNMKEEELFDKILYIVNQLNSGSSFMSTKEQKDRLAELNIMAAKKAKRAGAFESSLIYLKNAIALSDGTPWTDNYELTLTMHTDAAIAAYRTHNYDEMDVFTQIIIQYAHDVLDKVRAYEVLILAASNKNNMSEAISLGIETLRLLDIHIPKNPGRFAVYIQYLKIKRHLMKRKIASLHKLPAMKDKRAIAAIRIITMLHWPSQTSFPLLYKFNELKRFELSIKYGLTQQSGVAFASLAVILCTEYWLVDLGLELIKKAVALSKAETSPVQFMYNALMRFRKEHLRSILEPLFELYRGLLHAGDIQTSALALLFYADDFHTGRDLVELDKEFSAHSTILSKLQFPFAVIVYQLYRQQIKNFTGESQHPGRLTGDIFNVDKILPIIKKMNLFNLLYIIYLNETIAAYLFSDYRYAFEKTNELEKLKAFAFGAYIGTLFYFYDSLAILAYFPNLSRQERKKTISKVKQNQKKMKILAGHAPMNYLHKYHLIEAELSRIRGGSEAMDYYDNAIIGALANEYIQEAALACELAAKYWLDKRKENIARTYMSDAIRYYTRWGAAAKVHALKQQFSDLLKERQAGIPANDFDSNAIAWPTTATASLDISTIVKSSQALLGEFDLGRLLEKIMKLSITNAGAQKGSLLLDKDEGGLYVEAAGGAFGEIRVLQSISVGVSDDLPFSVVNYVYKTRENLVLNDALTDERFGNDPYIAGNKTRSILCSPIIHKGKLSGMLYLENNLMAGAFTPERLELLNILSSQAAISIENSRLLSEREKAAKLETEMLIAANIQTSLLPKDPIIDGYEITSYLKPADEVGGDYYDVIHSHGTDWIIIGDVSGHGVPAGLVMMMVQTSIHTAVKSMKDLTPALVVEIANKILYENIRMLGEQKYMSITIFMLGPGGTMHFSGLHQDILIYRADKLDVEVVETDGIWLGLKEKINDSVTDDMITLDRGDVMLIYTDGVTEAWRKGSRQDMRSAAHDMFGAERLAGTLKKHGARSTSEIRDEILKALADYECTDDVTMLILRRTH